MRKFGKTFVLAAALVMGMSLMAGCGDDKKEKGIISEQSTASESGEVSDNTDTAGMTLDEYIDYYGKDVTLGDYKGIEYENSPVQVTDADVELKVQEFVDSCATYEEDKESEAKLGDTVNIDFVGTVDGVEFDGGNTAGAGYDIVLGSGSFIDDFEDQIAGHKPGETFDVTVTFPDNYGVDDLNGKDAVFETTLNYIKIPVEAEYNDELVAANTDYSNTVDYENSIKEELQTNNNASALASAQNVVMVTAINNAVINNLSETEVAEEAEAIKASLQSQAEAYNIDYATYILYYYGYEDETEFDEYIKSVCEENLKEKMVVCAIAKAENITVTESEIAEYRKQIAEENGITEDDVTKYYAQEDVMYYTLADKVMQFMMDNGVNTAGTAEEDSTASEETETEEETEAE